MSVFSNDENVLQIRLEKARRNYQDALVFLENDYRSIAQIMHSYYPLAVLSKAAWHCYQVYTGGKTDEYSLSAARLFPVLLQSVYQSRYYTNTNGFSSLQEIRQKDWDRLKSLVDDAARRLVRAIENLAVIAYKEGKISRESFPYYRDSLYYQAFGYPIGRDDYTSSLSLFNAIFTGDEEMVSSVFHMDPSFFVKELEKISDLALNGIDNLVSETKKVNSEIREKVNEKKREKPDLTDRQASELVLMGSAYREKLEELRHKGDSYDLFSVEMNSLLSSDTCALFSRNAGECPSVVLDGFMASLMYPFIRFADRFYCFTGQSFYTNIAHSIRRILSENGVKTGFGEKLQKIFTSLISNLFFEGDVEDEYTFRGYKVDVVLLTSIRYINAYNFPEVYETRIQRRFEELKRKPKLGHIQLMIDTDSFSPLVKKSEGCYSISLSALASVAGDDAKTSAFYDELFPSEKSDPVENEEVFETVLSDEELEEPSSYDFDYSVDDVPPQVLLDDESEFDRTDDDEKARMIESRFDAEDSLPEDIPPRNNDISQTLDSYELPESLKTEEIREELSVLDSDDFMSGEEGELLDDEADETLAIVDEDEIEDDENDDLFVDDEEEAEDGAELDSDEEYEDEVPQTDYFYQAPSRSESSDMEAETTDDGQLSLFDGGDSSSAGIVEASEDEEADDEDAGGHLPPADDDEPAGFDPAAAAAEEENLVSGRSEESLEAESEEEELASEIQAEEDDEPLDDGDEDFLDEDETDAEEEIEEADKVGEVKYDDEPEALSGDVIVETSPSYSSETDFSERENTGAPHIEYSREDEAMESEAAENSVRLKAEKGDYPPLINEIIDKLEGECAAFTSFLSSVDSMTLSSFCNALNQTISAAKTESRDKMMVLHSFSLSLVITGSSRFDALRRMEIRNNAGAQMYARSRSEWTFILLSYNSEDRLRFAWSEKVCQDSFSPTDWKIVRIHGEELRKVIH